MLLLVVEAEHDEGTDASVPSSSNTWPDNKFEHCFIDVFSYAKTSFTVGRLSAPR